MEFTSPLPADLQRVLDELRETKSPGSQMRRIMTMRLSRPRVLGRGRTRCGFPNGTEHEVDDRAASRRRSCSLPMQDDDHVVLIRQYRASHRSGDLGAAGRQRRAGRDGRRRGGARECEEEIGLVPGRVERMRGLFPSPGFCDEELIFFRVSDLRPPPADSPHKPDEDEDIHAQMFTIAEAKAMAARGDIVDLKTAYGLTLI